MKRQYKFSCRIGIMLLSAFLLLNACKKDDPATPDNNNNNNNNNEPPQKVDSLKFYTWFINISDSANNLPLYLWYDQVPENFPWWSGQYEKAQDVLDGIAGYATVNGNKVDHYSFLDLTGAVSGELQGGVQGDFGFGVTPVIFQDNKIHLIINYVYEGSPAGEAGIQRGWDITSVNGNTDIRWDGSQSYKDLIEGLYFSPNSTFIFDRPNGSDTTISLNAVTYHINPILFDSVYTVNNKKVGYVVYNSFINVASDQNGAKAKQEIDEVFSKFKTEGINKLIVDLRYNGGGSVATAEYLDNLIAPASAVGQNMYKYIYNDMLTDYYTYWKGQGNETAKDAIDPVKFSTVPNNLGLAANSEVFFIVGRGTASASELTINNLKPYMDVKLIGDTTYGKPVGFFGIPIEYVTDTAGYTQVATMYAINFRTVNKNGKGEYYFGMTPDYYDPYFDVSNWGDAANDAKLAAALNYIETGSYERSGRLLRKVKQENNLRIKQGHRTSNPYQFNGMVDYRKIPTDLLRKNK